MMAILTSILETTHDHKVMFKLKLKLRCCVFGENASLRNGFLTSSKNHISS